MMENITLNGTLKHLLNTGKGLLAMDESTTTCNRQFSALNMPQATEHRRKYRASIVTTTCLEDSISGAIVFDESITQTTSTREFITDILYQKGILVGIKLDRECEQVTTETLHIIFDKLYQHKVELSNLILKPNMIVPGLACSVQESEQAIADATVKCFLNTFPATVPGIAFLFGGQPPELASQRLNSMYLRFKGKMPWVLTFSFSRAIQQPALEAWKDLNENVRKTQDFLNFYAVQHGKAIRGEY